MIAPSTAPATSFSAHQARILVVEGRFYHHIADGLLQGARDVLDKAEAEVTLVSVPGALEIPLAASIMIEKAKKAGKPFHALVALGCVIRGETGHYDIVAFESARALMDLGLSHALPMGNGILTVETEEQARERAYDLDKGGSAAAAALALLALVQETVI
jgi:6,7-dimethyl-8-ribityllumazine synthase